MRILLAGAAAAAFAFAATPASAQYGGSPAEQVDGAPGDPDMATPQGEEEDVAYPDEAPAMETTVDPEAEDAADAAAAKPGFEDGAVYAQAYPDTAGQTDPDDDYDVDADANADADEAAPVAEGGTWQGEDGRTYCRRSDGTTGLIVGGGAGALVGRGVDGGRRRGTGTIIGGIIGAIVGTAIERSANEQRCR